MQWLYEKKIQEKSEFSDAQSPAPQQTKITTLYIPFSQEEGGTQELYQTAEVWAQLVNSENQKQGIDQTVRPLVYPSAQINEAPKASNEIYILAFGGQDLSIHSARESDQAHHLTMEELAKRLKASGLLLSHIQAQAQNHTDKQALKLYWCDPGGNAKSRAKRFKKHLGKEYAVQVQFYENVFVCPPTLNAKGCLEYSALKESPYKKP